MRSAERRKANVLEVKCLSSLVGLSRIDRVRNKKVRCRAEIKRELVSRVEQRVLRWFGMTMEDAQKIGMSGEPWCICNCMCLTPPFLLGPVFYRAALPCSGGYHLERSGMLLQ